MLGHSQTKERDNREPKLRPKPARQSSTLPLSYMPTAFAGKVKRLDAIESGFSRLAPRLTGDRIKFSSFSRQKRTAGKLGEIGHLLLDGLA